MVYLNSISNKQKLGNKLNYAVDYNTGFVSLLDNKNKIICKAHYTEYVKPNSTINYNTLDSLIRDLNNLSTSDLKNDSIISGDSATVVLDELALQNRSLSEAGENITLGSPVYIGGNNKLYLAQANNIPNAQAIGIAIENKIATLSCPFITYGIITINDWTITTGNLTLITGCKYYLSETNAGKLITPPLTLSKYLVYIGEAISTNSLKIDITNPLKL